MPLSLDFPEITDAFRRFLLLPVRQIAHSFEALSTWLERRVKLADQLEQASRDYPVIRFEADAVMLSLDRLQAGALASSGKPDSLATHVSNAGDRFVRGIGGISTSIRQERILPDALGAFAGVFDDIARSVDRFAGPQSSMPELLFGHSGVQANDPAHRRASDLWGEAALAWRSVAGSTDQLRDLLGPVGSVMKQFATPGAPGETSRAPQTDPVDSYGRYILAALILLPNIPAFAKSLWDSLTIVVKTRMIDAFIRIEASINRVRATVINFFFVDLPGILRAVLSYSIAAQTVLLANLRFFTRFVLGYGALLITQLKSWFDAVADYMNKYIGYVNAVVSAINRVLNFDIGPIIGSVIGPLAVVVPEITIDDLITFNTDVARVAARTLLPPFFSAVNAALDVADVLPGGVGRRLHALPDLIRNALREPDPYPHETGPVQWPPGAGFPQVFNAFSGPGLANFRGAINHLGNAAAGMARDILGVGSVALNIIGDEFAAQADNAARIRSIDRFRALTATAENQARAVFGPDADTLRQQINTKPADKVAGAFESWFSFANFQALGEVIPAYARQLRELWQEKAEHGDDPTVRLDITSPRILAEHASLAGVSVRRVVIDGSGRPLDGDLLAEVARQFRGAVQQAYLDGQTRLRQYAGAVAV